jgi:NitT/TauT family transport system permease protein
MSELTAEVQDDTRRFQFRRRFWIAVAQAGVLTAVLSGWQWLPSISWLSKRSHIFDRFFISSPADVAQRLYSITFGSQNITPIWSYTWNTVSAATVGLAIGITLGGAAGLILGSFDTADKILRPFLVAMNATPRIALIPVVVLIFGPTFKGSVMVSVMVTFFIAFFNAYEGARTVTPQLIQNARILGANSLRITLHIRLPYVLAWTFAALPLAATFSVIAVVTGEILIGSPGLGRLINVATSTGDATLTFAVVIILSLLGVLTVAVAGLMTRRVLHWWGK